MSNGQKDETEVEGFALLAVLGFMLLFAMVLAPFAATSRIEALTASFEYDRARLRSAGEAVNGYMAWRLASDAIWRGSVDTGGVMSVDCTIADITVHIALTPHAALIHLNTAEEPLLKAGFEMVGLGVAEAEALADRVVLYRAPRPVEGEDATGVDGGFKHAAFEDLSELRDFEALQRFSLSELGRVFSVQSGRSLLSKEGSGKRLSEVYTVETALSRGQVQDGDAAVFLIGSTAERTRRLATIDTGRMGRPERGGRCSPVLDSEVARILEEIFV